MAHTFRSARLLAVLSTILVAVPGVAVAQLPAAFDRTILAKPAGPYSIGRVTYHWIDSTRTDSLARDESSRREVLVDVWYPTVQTVGTAPYLPDVTTLRRVLPDSVLRRRFAPAYTAAIEGRLVTHAVEGAPALCSAQGCPLLLFSHGGGIDRSLYTAQYEDLASHGYVVSAIAHTYLTHTVVFPDGRVVQLQDRRAIAPRIDSTQAYWRRSFAASAATNRFRYAHAAADIRFVLDQMSRLAITPGPEALFAGRLDLSRVGAIGHSMGGLAAALACRDDRRFKACMNQDGSDDGLPAHRDTRGRTLSQPFMYFGRVEPLPRPRADSVLARLQMTRAEDDSIRESRPREQTAMLNDVAGGAWRLQLKVPGAEHMSFSDELLIQAGSEPGARAAALEVLALVHRYTRAFFDKTLRGKVDTPLDQLHRADSAMVSVRRFPAEPVRAQP